MDALRGKVAWLAAFGALLGVSLVVLGTTYTLDAIRLGAPSDGGFLGIVFSPGSDTLLAAVSGLPEVIAGVLAIAITVVSIIVELASSRYTGRIAELFIADPVNVCVLGFFVVTGVHSIWILAEFDPPFLPVIGAKVAMVLCTISVLMLLPYFAYVFHFLSPSQVVERIRANTYRLIGQAVGSPRRVAALQERVVIGVEQLSDMSLNSVEKKDKAISMAAVGALRLLATVYQDVKARLPVSWFALQGSMAANPDFVSMSAEVLDDLAERRTWLELKVLRQYQMLYGESLNRMRDINYQIATNTRLIAEFAAARGDREVLLLAMKFFNTYLRATVNARDVRTAYNVLNQYRLLAEFLLSRGEPTLAIEVATHFKYYGQLAFGLGLPFVLETAAYDLCTLNELALDVQSPARKRLLEVFLQVDKESDGAAQEAALRGVRKAQVKLATYYLLRGDLPFAQDIFEDMRDERPERLRSIREELGSVTDREFWEVIDRVQNFDYLTPERKAMMERFFAQFGDAVAPVPR